jgi:hypothetical protein
VRYLGSTIVARDESRFCHLEGPSQRPEITEANRRADLWFDRIAPAVAVGPTKGQAP